ncbi:MAG: hypothetical protein AB7I27_14000 [Bacteriovoracaceae bacterium]
MLWQEEFKSTLTDLDTPIVFESLNTYLWGIALITTFGCIWLGLRASHSLSREEYGQALLTGSASVLVGISPFLANLFFYN